MCSYKSQKEQQSILMPESSHPWTSTSCTILCACVLSPTCVKIQFPFCDVYIDPGNPGKSQCLPHATLFSGIIIMLALEFISYRQCLCLIIPFYRLCHAFAFSYGLCLLFPFGSSSVTLLKYTKLTNYLFHNTLILFERSKTCVLARYNFIVHGKE